MELTEGHWCYIKHEAAIRYAASLNARNDPNYMPIDNTIKDTDSYIENQIKNEVIRLALKDIDNNIRLMKIKLELYNTIREIETEVDKVIDNIKTEDSSN